MTWHFILFIWFFLCLGWWLRLHPQWPKLSEYRSSLGSGTDAAVGAVETIRKIPFEFQILLAIRLARWCSDSLSKLLKAVGSPFESRNVNALKVFWLRTVQWCIIAREAAAIARKYRSNWFARAKYFSCGCLNGEGNVQRRRDECYTFGNFTFLGSSSRPRLTQHQCRRWRLKKTKFKLLNRFNIFKWCNYARKFPFNLFW